MADFLGEKRINHLSLLTFLQPSRVTEAAYSFSDLPSAPSRSISSFSSIIATRVIPVRFDREDAGIESG